MTGKHRDCNSDNAPCIYYSENNAVYRRDDGIVIIDPDKAKGQKSIVKSCPYRLIYWNEAKNIPQKCTFCAHLLDNGWKEPRCVEACPDAASTFGDLSDPDSEVSKLLASGKAESLHPEYGLNERVKYIGLPKKFVAGAVVFGDGNECGEDTVVTLVGDGEKKTLKADNFGDFEFDSLSEDKEYTVNVEHLGYKSGKFSVQTKNDVYLGEIILRPSRSK
jgi:NAD-dependent dihydropyrimidine dehydrogenase PreA subunit